MKDFIKFDLDISKIVLAVKVISSSDHQKTHINRPSHGLALHLGGHKIYHFEDGHDLEVFKDDIIFMPKRSSYEVEVIEASDCYAINFDFFTDKDFSPFVFRPKNSAIFFENFKAAAYLFRYKYDGYIKGCKSALYEILYNMEKEYGLSYVGKGKQALIAPAVEYIHKNYTKHPISVNSLAKSCGITPEYFRSIFKNHFGISPIKYINGLKIERSKELISSGLYSIADVAILSGFADPSVFSREFKKAVGIPPARFKENS